MYALKAFGGTEFVNCGLLTLPSTWTASATVIFDEVLPQKCYFYLGGGAEYVQVGYNSTGNTLKVWSNGKTPGSGTISVPINTPTDISLEWTGTLFRLYVNGVFDYSVTPSSSFVSSLNSLTLLRGFNSADRFKGQVREFVITGLREYKKEDFPSTGLVLPDSGPLNFGGTLENFGGYTADSWWVFYAAAGGVSASVALSIPAPTFAVSATATQPQPTSNIAFTLLSPTFLGNASVTLPQPTATSAFTIQAPTFSVSASATLPTPTANISFTITSPTFSGTANATLPQPTSNIGFTIAAPTFAGTASATLPGFNADVAFTIPSPSFSGAASATLPQPIADINYTIAAPTFSGAASVTEPSFIADVAFTFSAPTFAGSATVTLPQPTANGAFTISSPVFSGTATVSGLTITAAPDARITLEAGSGRITLRAASNRITI